MTDYEFWTLIGDVQGFDSDGEHSLRLIGKLSLLDKSSIIEFDRVFCDFHSALCTRNILAAGLLLNGGLCGDDKFRFFRNWIISRGRAVFEAALRDSDALANEEIPLKDKNGIPDTYFENYGYAAYDAYENVAGKDIYKEMKRQHIIVATDPEDSIGWAEFSNDELTSDYPKLWQKYGQLTKARQNRKPLIATSTVEELDLPSLGTIRVGDLIQHQKYGRGTIRMIDLDRVKDFGPKLVIHFPDLQKISIANLKAKGLDVSSFDTSILGEEVVFINSQTTDLLSRAKD